MRDLLKGAAVTVIVLIALMAINVFCNMNDIHSDTVTTGTVSAVCAMLIYRGLNKNEKK
ncbi:MAG: hypothetical protein HFH10_14235 [Dorea sp.]|nr:hypothetical protein [Dorea sp.]